MKVTHSLASISRDAGGPSRSVPQLASALRGAGVDSCVVAMRAGKIPSDQLEKHFHMLTSLWELSNYIKHSEVDIVHDHGLWLRFNHRVATAEGSQKRPRVVSPRGMLEPWALGNSKWKKKLAWALYQKQDLQRAVAFHATAPSEAESIRRLGFKQPIAVIPNGVQIPEVVELESGSIGMRKGGIKTALFLSRINPKKGLLMLLDAWKRTAPKGWRLLIAGNDDSNHLPTVERRINDLDLEDVVEYIGPLFGKNKEQAYRDADIFVLPSYSENFGIVVPEALSYQVPVLTTTGCPWEELETHACGWWVEPTIDGIEGGLRDAFRRDAAELNSMGARGRKLVEERYQWPSIAEKMSTFYDWILNGGSVPDFVYKD